MVMVHVEGGVQTITEVCDDCKCHMRDLHVDDILVHPGQGFSGYTLTDSQDREITNTEPRAKCYCEECSN
jgi:hypothetical protein